MQSTQKKPLTAFTVISTIFLLLLTVLFIFHYLCKNRIFFTSLFNI